MAYWKKEKEPEKPVEPLTQTQIIQYWQGLLGGYLSGNIPSKGNDIERIRRMIELLKEGKDAQIAKTIADNEFKKK